MSGLIGSLIRQAQALNAQGVGLNISGKNLANVNNAGYARQRVNISTNSLGGTEVTSISNARNKLIDTQIMREIMKQGSNSAQLGVANMLQSLLGEQVDTKSDPTAIKTGFGKALDSFFNAFSALAANPTEAAQKQQVLSAAQNLIDKLNSLSANLSTVQSDITTQINAQTTDAQTLLTDIADLNDQIAKIEVAAPNTALDLRDQRQAKIEELSKLMNFTVQDSPLGLGQIQIVASTSTGTSVLVNGPQVKGTLAYTGTGFTGGQPTATLSITTGSLAGYQAALTGPLADLQTNLDNIASQLVTSVNTAYGANFFRADTLNPTLYKSAATIQLDPSLTVSNLRAGALGGDAGDNSIAKAIFNLSTNSFSTGGGATINGTFADYYGAQVTSVANDISALENQQTSSDLVSSMLVSQRQSEAGVSTDEEMTNIMIFQRAYQGNARVINAMDTLLDVVVNRLGNF